jgi:L,D-transpeptidase catalytic domain/Putative peptidoglycan binding domain
MTEEDKYPETSAHLGEADGTSAPSISGADDSVSGNPPQGLPEASKEAGAGDAAPDSSEGRFDAESPPKAAISSYSTQNLVETPSTSPTTPETRRKRRFVPRLKTVVILLLFAIPLALLAGAALATYKYSDKYDGKILPGASIAGVDVGGMTRKEAMRAVKKALKPQMKREVSVTWRKKSWEVTPQQLGARSDAAAAVEQALADSGDVSMMEKAQMRWLGEDLDFTEDVALRYPKQGASSFIEGLASGFNENPLDASIDYSSGWVKIVPETMGRTVDTKKSSRNLLAALEAGEDTAKLEVETNKPEVLSSDFNQVLLLRQSDYKVYLYEDGKITHEWPVAVGTSTYPTPTGEWTVIDKVMGPSWTNPDPDGWGADMPAYIPPGPGNPLGLAAVYWDASGIRFHGTSDLGSIGSPASHGCVRMYNEDVIELYNIIEIGTPIISVI